jgi:long-chain fatty acid transport protein
LGAASTAINNQIRSRARGGYITADITLPATLSLSATHKLSERWEALADVTWTQWSTLQKLEFIRVEGGTLSSTQYNWRDTFRYSVGANYKLTDAVKLKMGIAYDQSPVPQQYRTARLPDNDRVWLSTGLQFALDSKTKIDIGYTYVKIKNTDLNNRREDNDPTGGGSGTLTGTFKQHVHILGAQFSYQF